jgi:hypothetical protein
MLFFLHLSLLSLFSLSPCLRYTYPESFEFSKLETFVSLTSEFMSASNMSIVNIIGHDSSEKYLGPYLQQDNIDALFYYTYDDNYVGLNGHFIDESANRHNVIFICVPKS